MPPRGRAQPPKKQPLKSTKAVVALCIVGLPIAFAAFLVGVAGVLVLMGACVVGRCTRQAGTRVLQAGRGLRGRHPTMHAGHTCFPASCR